MEGNPGEIISQTYDSPHYISLKQKLVDTIEIDIMGDTGQPIPFVSGKVIVKLHFRKRRSSYFNWSSWDDTFPTANIMNITILNKLEWVFLYLRDRGPKEDTDWVGFLEDFSDRPLS